MRAFCLLLTMVCFAIAIIHAQRWDLLGIEPSWDSGHNTQTWACAAGVAFAASFLPWGTRFRYWFGRTP